MMAQREIRVGIGQCRFSWRRQMITAPRALGGSPREDAGRLAYFCMKATQRFSAASPACDDHQA
jgi:hypothetical protein